MSAQETLLAVGRLRAIETFPAGLPLHIPQVTTSKDLQERPVAALRMICDRVSNTSTQTSSTHIVNPSASRPLRRMNTEETHFFADEREEPQASSSSTHTVAPAPQAQPKVATKPSRILERFDSEEALRRFR